MPKFNSIANMQMSTKCPMCNLSYEKNCIKVVDNKDGSITFYMNCHQCKSSIMMVVMAGPLGITSISMMSDLKENDLRKIKSKCIDCDDVLEIHKFFESDN